MNVHRMQVAAIVVVLSFAAGCVPVPPLKLASTPPGAAPRAPGLLATGAPPAQRPTAAPSSAPSASAPVGDLMSVVHAFEAAYNRHDVDATTGLFTDMGCIDWGLRGECGYWLGQLLRYDSALHRELALSDCRVEDGRVTCKGVQRDDCLAAGGLDETHFAAVVFLFEDGKISLVTATKTSEEAQRDLVFLYALAGWAHRTRPAEWSRAGREDLLDDMKYSPPFVDLKGTLMSALCAEYGASAPAMTPVPTPTSRQVRPAIGTPGSVLFIGDRFSLGLNGLLPSLAASGQPSVTVASRLHWYPSAALGAHYELGNALDDIHRGKWDVVVLEDDLQADWPARAAEFYEYGRKFDQAIRQAGAETVFTMVQPYGSAEGATTDEVAGAYGKIGRDLNAKVAPVGLAFRRSLQERPDLNLYAADRKHPSWAGIYLQACVLYATIFGRSPVGLTYRMQGPPTRDWQMTDAERYELSKLLGFNLPGADWQISEEDTSFLQRIAWETVQEYEAGR
jgi:hypothetical protein